MFSQSVGRKKLLVVMQQLRKRVKLKFNNEERERERERTREKERERERTRERKREREKERKSEITGAKFIFFGKEKNPLYNYTEKVHCILALSLL
jgi:hypothetical protein